MHGWQSIYRSRLKTADAAISSVHSGDRVFLHVGSASPPALREALARHAGNLRDVEIIDIITVGPAPYAAPECAGHLRVNALFTGGNIREAVQCGRADYTPVFLHEIESLFENSTLPLDVALLQVSPPDEHGFVSLGPNIDVSMTAARSAKRRIAQVNERMPRTYGDSTLPLDAFESFVEDTRPLVEYPAPELTGEQRRIGRHIASLIPDAATLQIGIGGIPEAVLEALHDRKDLGVHTEFFSDGMVTLYEKGVVNNSRKTLHPHKIITSFVLGSQRVYDFVDRNPLVEFYPNRYTNDPFVIGQNDRMVAVNAALEVDLTGQVCSDSIGSVPFSGVGGQADFIRGAARSRGGVPVIALPATAKGGALSRIVPRLKPGAGVVTSRMDVHYVATENGIASLHGRTLRQRAEALIAIADPKFQPELEKAAATLFQRG